MEKLRIVTTGNKTIFQMPLEAAERLQREYSFSLDQLKVGGDIPLADLAKHLDEQASNEASIGMFCESARYQYSVRKQEYDSWEVATLHKVRVKLLRENGKLTETFIKSAFQKKFRKTIDKSKKQLLDLEYQQRLLRLMLDAIKTKGVLLPTLRLCVQGRNEGLHGSLSGSIEAQTENKKKKKIKT